jgi:hypothetical protein
LGALGSVLDRTDSLISPLERTYEHGHVMLRVVTHKDYRPLRRRE